MTARPLLYIFVKAPFIGAAKTRLAADIGGPQAMRLYRAMSAQIIRRVQDPRWDTVLYVTPRQQIGAEFGGIWPAHVPRVAQPKGSLSPRLAAVFSQKRPTIVIGSDCPFVTRCDIAASIAALRKGDAVVGPANDGGFWLLGTNGPAPRGLFENIRWSHSETLSDLERRLGTAPARLRTLMDIDDGAALRRWRMGECLFRD